MSDERLLDVVVELRKMARSIRTAVLEACANQSVDELSAVAHETQEDTIFTIDKVSEAVLLEHLTPVAARLGGIVLIAEGVGDGQVCLPESLSADQARYRIIMDPIDGTRGLMYQKRSAWLLAGIAHNHGPQTSLKHIVGALQMELPTLKAAVSDELWAIRGEGTKAERYELSSGKTTPLNLQPSRARSIENGYAMLSRFFPGARDELAAIDEALVERVLGRVQAGRAPCFEDQYASTGGQLYELSVGHDRFNADLRPLMQRTLAKRGAPLGLCCHPYDVCTLLIAEQLGVLVTAPDGSPLDVPLDLDTPVAWVGYANQAIKDSVEPVLLALLKERRLIA